jgi:hypothetical protein
MSVIDIEIEQFLVPDLASLVYQYARQDLPRELARSIRSVNRIEQYAPICSSRRAFLDIGRIVVMKHVVRLCTVCIKYV